MAHLLLMSGPGASSYLLLLLALSTAAVTDRTANRDIVKTLPRAETKRTATNVISRENKAVQSPKKRHIRKFDFDEDFASYLGLASQSDTARYLAGDKDSSYRAPARNTQDLPDFNLNRPLRLVPGSTPASFAFLTQIYPDKQSNGDIRIDHFNPVIHPQSSEREKNRHRDKDDDEPEHDQAKSNYDLNDEPVYSPPTSRSYFGRYSNKQRYMDSPKEEEHKPRYLKTKNIDDVAAPDYKMGYRKFGMYHKFHKKDLYPKKTSSEWIPLKKYSKPNQDEPEGDYDARVSSEDFHASSEHDSEVDRIKTNINNDPPYSTNNFDLDETGQLKLKTAIQESDDFSSEPQPVRRHKKKKRKHHRKHRRPHQEGRPAFRSAPNFERFTKPERDSEHKSPSFEFINPVSSYVYHPHNSPGTNKNLQGEPLENQPETHESTTGSELLRSEAKNDYPVSSEVDKDHSLEDPSDEPADIDYGKTQFDLDDLDKDYHIIREAGQRDHVEHTKDFDKRLPEPDSQLYGSFETFDSQLDSTSKKKFEPFVKYPFDTQRQKLECC